MPKQPQHRGVQVVHLHNILHGVVAQLVGLAVGDAGPDATASHPEGKALDVVVAACALVHGRAAKLAAPDHQRIGQQPRCLRSFTSAAEARSTSPALTGMSRFRSLCMSQSRW